VNHPVLSQPLGKTQRGHSLCDTCTVQLGQLVSLYAGPSRWRSLVPDNAIISVGGTERLIIALCLLHCGRRYGSSTTPGQIEADIQKYL